MEFEVVVSNLNDLQVKSNLEELRAFVNELNSSYVSKTITAENVRDAKQSLADFRKMRKAVTDKMASVKKELLLPFEEVNLQVKSIMAELDHIEAEMKEGIDNVVEQEKRDKYQRVLDILELEKQSLNPEVRLLVEEYYNQAWDNKTCSEASIKEDFQVITDNANAAYKLIKGSLHKTALVAVFKRTYSVSEVMDEIERLEKLDKEIEQRAEQIVKGEAVEPESDSQFLAARFVICGTKAQIMAALKALDATGVVFKRDSKVAKVSESYRYSLKRKEA